MISANTIVSTREALREIEDSSISELRDWAAKYPDTFPAPTNAEGQFVAKIFAVSQFQANIEKQKLYKGGHNADPFIIAKAKGGE
jgi:hypothetical protein